MSDQKPGCIHPGDPEGCIGGLMRLAILLAVRPADDGLWTDDAVMRSWFSHPARRQDKPPYDWATEDPSAPSYYEWAGDTDDLSGFTPAGWYVGEGTIRIKPPQTRVRAHGRLWRLICRPFGWWLDRMVAGAKTHG